MIKNIVFDMGQVLIKFEPEYFLKELNLGNEDVDLLRREVFQSVEWARMDRGSLDEEDAYKIMCERLPERLHSAVHSLVFDWCKPLMPVPGMAELVKELKAAGYGIYLLSNASHMQHAYWNDIPGSECFDGSIISADENLVKPQPEIYMLLTSRFGLIPEESVFIDDRNTNCEGAYFCGFNAIVFHDDVQELCQKLSALGVRIMV